MKSHQLLLFIIVIAMTCKFALGQENLPSILPPEIKEIPAPPVPELESSTIEIPLQFSLDAAFKGIEESFPIQDFNKKWIVNGWVGLKYKTWREPLFFSLNGNHLRTGANFIYQVKTEKGFKLEPPLSYIIRFLYTDQCGSKNQQFGASTYIDTEFNLDHKWALTSKTQDIKSYYTINLCPLKFGRQMAADVAMQARQQQMNSIAETLNKEINHIDLRPSAEKAWNILSSPITAGDTNSWLSFNPETVTFDSPRGEKSSISIAMYINVRPRIEMTPPASGKKILPQLPIDEKYQKFRVVAEHRFSFDEASDELEDQLLGKEFKLASKTIQITAVKLTGSGSKAIIKLRFIGDLIGTVYLHGELTLEQPTRSLVIQNLDFTDETKEALKDASLDSSNETSLLNGLATDLKWSLNKEINEDVQELNTKISQTVNDQVSYVSRLSAGEILQAFAENDDVVIRYVAEGPVVLQLK